MCNMIRNCVCTVNMPVIVTMQTNDDVCVQCVCTCVRLHADNSLCLCVWSCCRILCAHTTMCKLGGK